MKITIAASKVVLSAQNLVNSLYTILQSTIQLVGLMISKVDIRLGRGFISLVIAVSTHNVLKNLIDVQFEW